MLENDPTSTAKTVLDRQLALLVARVQYYENLLQVLQTDPLSEKVLYVVVRSQVVEYFHALIVVTKQKMKELQSL